MQPRKPLWIDGSFLEPHHLQSQDRYHERLIARRVGAVLDPDWGVLDLEVDPRALQAGEVHVARLDAILPDGTPLLVGGASGDTLPPRRLEDVAQFVQQGKSVDVYVAIAREQGDAANVDLAGDPMSYARYARAQSPVLDFNSGSEERAFDWARHNARIVFGHEPRDRFDAIRIAQLERSASGALVLRERFVPPVLRIGASELLTAGFRRVLRAMHAKQQSLADSRRQRSASLVEFQAGDAAKFWLLHTLNGALPALAEVVDKPSTPPREAYAALASILGQLCTFDAQGDPLGFPRFDHLRLGEVFEPMFTMLVELLDRVVTERHVRVPLELRDGLWLGELRDPSIFRYAFYVAASGSYPEAQIRDQLPKLAKIASVTQIGALMHSHVNGARLGLEHRPPGALPLKPGVTFFRLETSGEFWMQMIANGSIAIHTPFDPAALHLALYAVDPSTLQ